MLLGCLMSTCTHAMATPLHVAVERNDADLVEEKLVKEGANVNELDDETGKTPLTHIQPGRRISPTRHYL